MSALWLPRPKRPRDREYIESNLVNAMDWRNQLRRTSPGLGTMESNGDKLGEPDEEAGHGHTRGESRARRSSSGSVTGEVRGRLSPPPRDQSMATTRASDWAKASVPALTG